MHLQDRRLDLMSKYAQLETQVFEAKSREARATAAQAQAEHEVADIKAHVQRLIDQLESHREALQAEKASSSSQVQETSCEAGQKLEAIALMQCTCPCCSPLPVRAWCVHVTLRW